MRRVGIVFSGGPAPAANAVITSCVMAFRRHGIEVVGFRHGYRGLVEEELVEGEHWFQFESHQLRGLRNERGIIVGTARANPGKLIRTAADLDDPDKTALLDRVYRGLCSLDIDGLISIGGEDTLRTANLLHLYQQGLPEGSRRVRIVHLPKTIDNDYRGIDFTFGFFTAVDVIAKELLNLRADAMATSRYYVCETMGRKAAWLPYGVAIAGEAHMVVGVEDVVGPLAIAGSDPPRLDVDALCDRITQLVLARRESGRDYGVIVLAEGLAELLPAELLEGLPRDPHGHISISRLNLAQLVAERAAERFSERTGTSVALTSVQLGYEARCAPPHAFDVVLGCQLGQGAYVALVERGLDAHLVSVEGQMTLQFVPFADLIDQVSLNSQVRFVERDSDFHRLAHALGTSLEGRPPG
jgi:6-phosphofructokinase 1